MCVYLCVCERECVCAHVLRCGVYVCVGVCVCRESEMIGFSDVCLIERETHIPAHLQILIPTHVHAHTSITVDVTLGGVRLYAR